MSFDILIAVFKIAGAAIAGALGIVAVIFEFKNNAGRVNKWGALVIIGIFLSTLLVMFSSIVESQKASVVANERAARTEKLLNQLSRSIQPITKLEITYWIKLPHDEPIVSSYINYITAVVDNYAEELVSVPTITGLDGIDASVIGKNDEILTVSIEPNSEFWPTGEHAIIGDLARYFTFSVHIRKDAIEPQDFDSTISVKSGYSDWLAWGLPLGDNNQLDFDTRSGELYIFGTFSYNKKFWKSNGLITSIPDLRGAQLFLIPNHSTNFELPKRYDKFQTRNLKPLTRSLEIRTVMLKFSDGIDYWIDGSMFEKTPFKFGFPAFSITLPETEEEMQKLNLDE